MAWGKNKDVESSSGDTETIEDESEITGPEAKYSKHREHAGTEEKTFCHICGDPLIVKNKRYQCDVCKRIVPLKAKPAIVKRYI